MKTITQFTLPLCLLGLIACGQTTAPTETPQEPVSNIGDSEPSDTSNSDDSDSAPIDEFAVRADNLIDRVSQSVCGALTRCCDTESQV